MKLQYFTRQFFQKNFFGGDALESLLGGVGVSKCITTPFPQALLTIDVGGGGGVQVSPHPLVRKWDSNTAETRSLNKEDNHAT
jgi:hypothetical protein